MRRKGSRDTAKAAGPAASSLGPPLCLCSREPHSVCSSVKRRGWNKCLSSSFVMTWYSLMIGAGSKLLQRPSVCQTVIKLAAQSEVQWTILCLRLSPAWWRQWHNSRGFWSLSGGWPCVTSPLTLSTVRHQPFKTHQRVLFCCIKTSAHMMTQSLWFILIEKSTGHRLPKYLATSYLISNQKTPR